MSQKWSFSLADLKNAVVHLLLVGILAGLGAIIASAEGYDFGAYQAVAAALLAAAAAALKRWATDNTI